MENTASPKVGGPCPAGGLSRLPSELLDHILLHTITWPEHGQDWKRDGSAPPSNLFAQPVLRVCTDWRARSIRLISGNCIFVRMSLAPNFFLETFLKQTWNMLKSDLILVNPNHPLVSSDDMCVFDLKFRWAKIRLPCPTWNTLMFCYDFTSMLRLYDYFGGWSNLIELSVSISGVLREVPKRCVCEKILPSFQWCAPPYSKISYFLEGVLAIEEHIDLHPCDYGTIQRPALNARGTVEWAKRLWDAGAKDEAGALCLFAGSRQLHASRHFFCDPLKWSSGETDPAVPWQASGNFARNSVGNDFSFWLWTLKWNAATMLWDSFQRYGYDWVKAHGFLFGLDYEKVKNGWSLFPRSHLFIGLAYWYQAFGADVLHRQCQAYATYRDEVNPMKLSVLRDTTAEDCCRRVEEEAARSYCIAEALVPDNRIFREAVRDIERVLPPPRFHEIQDRVKGEIVHANHGGIEWTGPSELWQAWGGPDFMQYLPLARQHVDATGISWDTELAMKGSEMPFFIEPHTHLLGSA